MNWCRIIEKASLFSQEIVSCDSWMFHQFSVVWKLESFQGLPFIFGRHLREHILCIAWLLHVCVVMAASMLQNRPWDGFLSVSLPHHHYWITTITTPPAISPWSCVNEGWFLSVSNRYESTLTTQMEAVALSCNRKPTQRKRRWSPVALGCYPGVFWVPGVSPLIGASYSCRCLT